MSIRLTEHIGDEPQLQDPSDLITPSQVINAFQALKRSGFIPVEPMTLLDPRTEPADLLVSGIDPQTEATVRDALELYRSLDAQHYRKLVDTQDPIARDKLLAQNCLVVETILTDAGFLNPDYTRPLVYERLLPILDFAETAKFDDIAASVRSKIISLNDKLPEPKKLQGTLLANDLLAKGLITQDRHARLVCLNDFRAVSRIAYPLRKAERIRKLGTIVPS